MRRVRAEMERHEGASHAYEAAGLQILERAQSAYSSYVTRNRVANFLSIFDFAMDRRILGDCFSRAVNLINPGRLA